MALALTNGVRKAANRIARIVAAEMAGRAHDNPSLLQKGVKRKGQGKLARGASYEDIERRVVKLANEWAVQKELPAAERTGSFSARAKTASKAASITRFKENLANGTFRIPSAEEKAILASAHRIAMTQMKRVYGGGRGFIKRQAGAKGGRYKVKAKSVEKTAFGGRVTYKGRAGGKAYADSALQAYNLARVGSRKSDANFDYDARKYREAIGTGKKFHGVSGRILLEKGWSGSKGTKKRNSKKSGNRSAAQLANDAKLSKIAQLRKVVRKATGASTKGMSVEDLKAAARAHGGYSNNNPGVFGGLALTNPGVFGGLALTNGPFVVAGVSAIKLIGTGAAAALTLAAASSYVDEYLPKVPVIGEYLSNLTVPAAVPMIGGITLNNTVAGTLIGGLTIGLSQFIGRKIGSHQVIQYGSAIGTGILLIGPALDIAAGGAGGVHGISSEELGGLALDNYGGIAVDNTGAYGDGMAYQLGAISGGDDYGQASLGDAFYSGADFDANEGQAMLQGRDSFLRKFGSAPHRIDQHGGRAGGASHLAGRAGHRWGWLVKMIGWQNAEKIAALPPKQRVRVLKGLRENALATFKQLTQQDVAATLAPDEFAAIPTAGGADGVHGAHSSYGSTIFGGQGL